MSQTVILSHFQSSVVMLTFSYIELIVFINMLLFTLNYFTVLSHCRLCSVMLMLICAIFVVLTGLLS